MNPGLPGLCGDRGWVGPLNPPVNTYEDKVNPNEIFQTSHAPRSSSQQLTKIILELSQSGY